MYGMYLEPDGLLAILKNHPDDLTACTQQGQIVIQPSEPRGNVSLSCHSEQTLNALRRAINVKQTIACGANCLPIPWETKIEHAELLVLLHDEQTARFWECLAERPVAWSGFFIDETWSIVLNSMGMLVISVRGPAKERLRRLSAALESEIGSGVYQVA